MNEDTALNTAKALRHPLVRELTAELEWVVDAVLNNARYEELRQWAVTMNGGSKPDA